MTPILVMVFGIAPQTAVGTDPLFAAVTKFFGAAVHQRRGTVDWQVVRRLAAGSVPAAAATALVLGWLGTAQIKEGLILKALGLALVLTAVGLIFKTRLHSGGASASDRHAGCTQSSTTRTYGTCRSYSRGAGHADVGGGGSRPRDSDAGLPVPLQTDPREARGYGPGPRDSTRTHGGGGPSCAGQRRLRPARKSSHRIDSRDLARVDAIDASLGGLGAKCNRACAVVRWRQVVELV